MTSVRSAARAFDHLGHVGSGEVEQPADELVEARRVCADVGKEAVAVGRAHVGMILEQLYRATDPG